MLFISIFYQSAFAQKDGYWDKDRATTKEIVVSARDRILIKTDDFPVGTTELIYRITLLDENQQLASSLVSVLKAIPDPTGISQGSAGAVFVLSKVSGSDKCKYAVFSSSELALEYQKKAKKDKACLVQDTPVSKDAKRLSVDKSACLKPGIENLWFGFESTNWILKQKIILEVVPWVDTKLSRGWSLENRKSIINQCETSALARKLANSDDFCVCIQEKMEKKYKFQEFQKLLAIEQAKVYKDFGNSCFNETGASRELYNDLRKQAAGFAKKGDYGNAIAQYATIINEGKATVLDYNAIGTNYILTKQYGKAIKFLKEGVKLDDSELLLKLNLAHAYLLNNNYSAAKAIYKEYQTQNVTDSLSWSQKVKLDFETFKKAGLSSGDFDRVLKLLGND
ncbi:tetratricopeptide repeat protein [Flavobacterium granuli]|uniref:Tetratricopeptide repeat protein n=1 Tax=Flavobacterium granuli TaxID=280093 RepID=A0A1M5T1L8_9FLAO|nr:tetratricopeptide repeat protein [Flavobacterium granuli]SHH44661.1 Tetratricopeptide repeat-containing protein [Flavobacterium granuli]